MDKIRKFYSEKAMAMAMAHRYAEQEEQTIYLYESPIGKDEFQYSLRFRSEIVDPESKNVLRTYNYVASGRIDARITERPQATATGYNPNLPTGERDHGDDIDEDDMEECPVCDGDSKKHDSEFCFTCEGNGEVTPHQMSQHKSELIEDQQSNQ